MKSKYLSEPDYILFILTSVLIIIGIIFTYSLSIYIVQYNGYSQFHFFVRQLFIGIISILIMWVLAHTKPEKSLPFFGWILFVVFLFMMIIMPFMPNSIVPIIGGAKRWYRLPGFSLSAIEFFKIGFIYFLSWSFTRRVLFQTKNLTVKQEFILILPYFGLFILVIILVAFLQKDFGQIVLLGLVLFVLLILANISGKFFLIFITISMSIFAGLIIVAPHRIQRIQSWWSMVQDSVLTIMPNFLGKILRINEFPEPYQVAHSLNAIHNGGYFGKGIGEGSLKLGFLSDVHTDFVLAGITEELGLTGLCIIVFLYSLIIIRIYFIGFYSKNPMYYLFCIAMGSLIIFSFIINSFGISGIIPIKGMAVPFLSYGGSSLLSLSIAMGLVLSISRSSNMNKDATTATE